MRHLTGCVFLACSVAAIASADTVYFQAASTEEELVAKDVLVANTAEWSGRKGLAWVSYYYWHPRNKVLTKRTVSAQTGESYRVERSRPEDKQRILSALFVSGISGAVTNVTGDLREMFCLRSHYVRRGVRYIGVADPEDDTLFEIVPAGTGRVEHLDFSDLTRIEFVGKKSVIVVQRDGKSIRGEFHDFNYDVYLYGLDKNGKDVELRFSDVMKIEFAAKATGGDR